MGTLLEDTQQAHDEDPLCFRWGFDDVDVVEDEVVDERRWTVWHRAVLKRGDEYVAVTYGLGATEYQENEEEIYLEQVKPVEVTVTKYVKL